MGRKKGVAVEAVEAVESSNVTQKLNISALIRSVLETNPTAKTQEVADILSAQLPDSKELAEALVKPGFQSSVSIIRGKLKGGTTATATATTPRGTKTSVVSRSQPTALDLIKFLDAATVAKIDISKLRETLEMVKELGGETKVLAMSVMLHDLMIAIPKVEQLKAVLTTMAGTLF